MALGLILVASACSGVEHPCADVAARLSECLGEPLEPAGACSPELSQGVNSMSCAELEAAATSDRQIWRAACYIYEASGIDAAICKGYEACSVLAEPTPDLSSEGIPLAPADRLWLIRHDDPTTEPNEAACDLARLADPELGEAGRESYVQLTSGAEAVILVGGTGHESNPNRWNEPVTGWIAERNGGRSFAVQVSYALADALEGTSGFDQAIYPLSLNVGITNTTALFDKVASAGSRAIWIFGHSKGADVAGNAAMQLVSRPELLRTVIFGVPYIELGGVILGEPVAPEWDDVYKRSGLFRYQRHRGFDFAGKLVVFNRFSDNVANFNGDLLHLIDDGHEYKEVWADPSFRQLVDHALDGPPEFEDREAGRVFDFPAP